MFPLRLAAAILLLFAASVRADEKSDKGDIAEFKARAGNITATAISDDGQFILTGEDDGLVTLWSVTSGTSVHNYSGHAREVFAAAMLPGGQRAVTCGDDDLLIVWDLATGKRLREIHTGDAIPVAMSCSPDGALAATGCYDGQIIVWSLADGRRVATLPHAATLCGILYSPDGKLLAAGYSDGAVVIWDAATWAAKHTLPADNGASVGALSFSGDSRLLATGNQNGAGYVWDTATGAKISAFAGHATPDASPTPPVAPVFPGSTITPDDRGAIVYLCMSPDAKMILGSIQDNSPHFWDTNTGRVLGTGDWFADTRFYIARYGFTYATAAVTPKRDYIVTLKDNLAQVWHLNFTPNPVQ